MRRFSDHAGRRWEVVAGRESWGGIVALFVSVDEGDELRQTPLQASSYEQANLELAALDESALTLLLERSTAKSVE